MKKLALCLRLVLCAVAVSPVALVSGCSGAGTQAEQTGTMRMALTSTTGATTYRLRNAVFDIAGPVSTTIDGELDPNTTVLDTTLAVGSYTSSIRSGWVLERMDGTTFVPVNATLLSPNPAAFEIIGGSTTNLIYRFQTDGTIVTIGDGTLAITIDVTETGTGGTGNTGACTFLDATTCPAGQWCAILDPNGATTCIPSGTIPVGGTCDGSAPCVQNALCFATDATGTVGQCVAVCDLATGVCSDGTACQDFGFAQEGACSGNGGNTGACTFLDPNTCPPGQWCAVADQTGATTCVQSGTIPVGGTCDGSVACVQDAVCVATDATGTVGQCLEVCDLATGVCSNGLACQSVGFPQEGVCF